MYPQPVDRKYRHPIQNLCHFQLSHFRRGCSIQANWQRRLPKFLFGVEL